MPAIGDIGSPVIIVILILLGLAIIKFPIKIIFKLLLNTALGFVALLLINAAGSLIGVAIAVNWINAAIVGILGVSGVALILLLQWLAR
ncbi:MAG: pro-sigmaK processing inhibitor BofA family protein [Oscillospiraceae bacterium]|nr:pro-sigmaK processing inhibitor BofA family protein [Oscillospiraceae bacterium]